MSHHIQNTHASADVADLQSHVSHLKGKYAQNAKNYEANTGKPLNLALEEDKSGCQSEEQLTFVERSNSSREPQEHKVTQSGKGEL